MLVAASICPHPPLLVPGVCAREPDWLAELRTACVESVWRLGESRADRVVVVGGADRPGRWRDDAGGVMRRFGVAAAAGGPRVVLPLALTVGASLLDEAAWPGRREYAAVAWGTSPGDCVALGSSLVDRRDDIGLLVMGDGSAKRSTDAPGYLDERAGGFDAAMVKALSEPSLAALLSIDPAVADDLWVAGREAWQVLAGAAMAIPAASGVSPIATFIRYDDAPLGVGYAVIDWSIRADTTEP